jgi:hypothetical protein
MNLELTLSKILTVLNIVIGMMMTFDDFNKSSKFCHQLPFIHPKIISSKFTIWSLIAFHTCDKIVHKGSIYKIVNFYEFFCSI